MKSLLAGAVLLALVGLVSVSQGTDDPGGLAERPSLESEPPASDPRPVTTSPPPPRDLWHELWYDADSGVPVWPASHFLLSKSPRGLFNSDTNLPPRFEVQPVPLIGKDVQEDWYPVVEGLRTEYFSAGEQVTYYYYAFGYPVLQFSKEPYACFLLDVPGAEEERQFIVEHLDDFMLLDGLGGKYRCVREPAFNHLVRPFQLGGAWGTLVFPGLPDEATDITLRVPLPSPDGTVREWADYRFKRLRSASPPLTLKAWPSKPLFEEGEVLSFDVEISNTAGQDLRVCQTNVRPRRWGASQAYGNEIRLSNPRLEEQEISLGPGQTWRGTVVVKKLRLSYCSPEGQSNIYSIATCITLDVATFGYFSDKYPWVGALGTDWFTVRLKAPPPAPARRRKPTPSQGDAAREARLAAARRLADGVRGKLLPILPGGWVFEFEGFAYDVLGWRQDTGQPPTIPEPFLTGEVTVSLVDKAHMFDSPVRFYLYRPCYMLWFVERSKAVERDERLDLTANWMGEWNIDGRRGAEYIGDALGYRLFLSRSEYENTWPEGTEAIKKALRVSPPSKYSGDS